MISVWITRRAALFLLIWLRFLFDLLLLWIFIFYFSLLLSIIHLLLFELVELRNCKFSQRRSKLILVFNLFNFMFFLVPLWVLRAWRFRFLLITVLLYTLKKSKIVFKDGFWSDCKATALHILFDIIHLILNTVLILELSFGL